MAKYLFFKLSDSRPRNVANFGLFLRKVDYDKYYEVLGIEVTSDQDKIKTAYLGLVKRYHPDSGTEEANVEKFQEVDKAFRVLMTVSKKSKEERDIAEGVIVDHPDIKHTAPQHRQYLSYDGIGTGNPFQRQKQYAKVRAMQAATNVYDHRMSKVAAEENAVLDKNKIYESWEKVPLNHKIKTKHGFDRLVEDLIQESMSKGEFNNLKGRGKPLQSYQNRNPYVDFVTHKINEVLIDNGFSPEWISLQKEIRQETKELRNGLLMERKYFGPYPLSVEENVEWSDRVYKYRDLVNKINNKITKFNLVVPILNKQMLLVNLEIEAQKAIVQGKSSSDVLRYNDMKKVVDNSSDSENFLSIIHSFFKSK